MTKTTIPTDTDINLDAHAVVAAFYDAFEADPADRPRRIAEAFAPDVHFTDPIHQSIGTTGLEQMADDLNARFPGARFNRPSTIQAHHRQIHFHWSMDDADGHQVVAGHDLLLVGDDGLITHDYSFFE